MLDKTLNIRGTLTSLATPLVMGILNITPDSFYAGSRKQTETAIEDRIREILSEGGDCLVEHDLAIHKFVQRFTMLQGQQRGGDTVFSETAT